MSNELSRQSIIDEGHVELLSLGYLISAATTAFFFLFGLMYAVMCIVISTIPIQQQEDRGRHANSSGSSWLDFCWNNVTTIQRVPVVVIS